MKQRPILFSTPMIQAILAGNKSQTRRIITKHRSGPCDTHKKKDLDWNPSLIYPNNPYGVKLLSKVDSTVHRVYPPYEPGDQLWVRETFRPIMKDIQDPDTYQRIDTVVDYYEYKADKQPHIQELLKWKPSIFMPRETSRITLEITDIRVERLHDITEKDAEAEGVFPCREKAGYRESFAQLWEKINGPESWEKNPWVWKLSFRRVEG